MTFIAFCKAVRGLSGKEILTEKQTKVLMSDFYLKTNVNEDDVLRAAKKLEEMK